MGWQVTQQKPRKKSTERAQVTEDYSVAENDKVIPLTSPAQSLCVCENNVWVSQADGGVTIFNSRTSEVLTRFENGDSEPETMTFLNRRRDTSNRSKKIVMSLICVESNGTKYVWMGFSHGRIEIRNGNSFELVHVIERGAAAVTCFAEFGGLLYSSGEDKVITQWNIEVKQPLSVFEGEGQHEGTVRCLLAEGNAVVSGADDCTVKVWNVGSRKMELTGYFHAHCGGVHSLCRVWDCIWSGDGNGQIIAWKFRTCEPVSRWKVHKQKINSLLRVGQRVYAMSADGFIAVMSATGSGQVLQRIQDHAKGSITCSGRTGDLSRFLLWSADASGTVRCWHHDEFMTNSRDREIFSDPSWYRSGSTPYQEFRNAIAVETQRVREKLTKISKKEQLSSKLNECLTIMQGVDPLKTKAYHIRLAMDYEMEEKRKQCLQQEMEEHREEIRKTENDIQEALGKLQSLQADLQRIAPGLLGNREDQNPSAIVHEALQGMGACNAAILNFSSTISSPPLNSFNTSPGNPDQQQSSTFAAQPSGVQPIPAYNAGFLAQVPGVPPPPGSAVPPSPSTSVPQPPGGYSVPPPPGTSGVPPPPGSAVPPSPSTSVPQPPGGYSVPPPPGTSGVPPPPGSAVPPSPSTSVPQPPGGYSVPPPPGASGVPPPPGSAVPPSPSTSVPQPPGGYSVPPPPGTSGVPPPPGSAVPPSPSTSVPQPPGGYSVPPPPGTSGVPPPPGSAVPPSPSTSVPQPPGGYSVPPPPGTSGVPPPPGSAAATSTSVGNAEYIGGYSPVGSANVGVLGTSGVVGRAEGGVVGVVPQGFGKVAEEGDPLEVALRSIDILTKLINNVCKKSNQRDVGSSGSVVRSVDGESKASSDVRKKRHKSPFEQPVWSNPNIRNYIQRRYYSAGGLRTSHLLDAQKKERKEPKVKVVPLKSIKTK